MAVFGRELRLGYRREDLFDLVADIERYPEFVPGYREARVVARQAGQLEVVQQVGLGPLRFQLHTVAELERPHRVDVRSYGNPLADLHIGWRFACQEGLCLLSFRADYRLHGGPPALLLERWLGQLHGRVVDAFASRAQARLVRGRCES